MTEMQKKSLENATEKFLAMDTNEFIEKMDSVEPVLPVDEFSDFYESYSAFVSRQNDEENVIVYESVISENLITILDSSDVMTYTVSAVPNFSEKNAQNIFENLSDAA